jgi:transcriptional regulator with XRE-family HTH domain
LPFCHVTLKAPKPLPDQYPQTLTTLGDHLRKKRLDLGLHQSAAARLPGATTDTVTHWENNRAEPSIPFLPKIISFLGYVPLSFLPEDHRQRFVAYRRLAGISQEECAKKLGVDPGTLRRWERGRTISKECEKKISALFLETISGLAVK